MRAKVRDRTTTRRVRPFGRGGLVRGGGPLSPRHRRSAYLHFRGQWRAPEGRVRAGEFSTFRENYHLNLIAIDAKARFLAALKGITDPEQKRKAIGRVFIEVFEEEAAKVKNAHYLVQGTLYPDVIESVSFKGPSAVIKSHHNVGGLPERMKLKLIEPLRELFKDEVRAAGETMGMPRDMLWRQPFPGPGLAIRCLGEVTEARLAVLRGADAIVTGEIRAAGLYETIWQSFCVLLPVRSVGVMGDERTYEETCAIRAVVSVDGMTADWAKIPYEVLGRMSTRIINGSPRGSTASFTTFRASRRRRSNGSDARRLPPGFVAVACRPRGRRLRRTSSSGRSDGAYGPAPSPQGVRRRRDRSDGRRPACRAAGGGASSRDAGAPRGVTGSPWKRRSYLPFDTIVEAKDEIVAVDVSLVAVPQ